MFPTASKLPLVLERGEEFSILHFFDDFYSDAAGDVDASQRQDLQREIACLGTVDGGPEVERFDADSGKISPSRGE